MSEPVIELRNVYWYRDKNTILDGVNWKVGQGEHWALLGLNGSGKTTLLNMINGYLWPSQGQVSVLGRQLGTVDVRELRKKIGWVSSSLQERLYPAEKTQNVVISGKFASIGLYDKTDKDDMEKAIDLMKQLSCGHLIDRAYQSCSQGEKQKILIARALMASPELLILDEATNGLDFLSKESLLASISELASKPGAPTMLLVTHHIDEIVPVFSRTLLIRRGRVFDQGKSVEVLTGTRLSEFFETDVQVRWQNRRAWLSIPQDEKTAGRT
jgi:iron complex transport system ATP-binding protein